MTECLLFIGLLHFIFLIVPNKVCKPVFKVSYWEINCNKSTTTHSFKKIDYH